MEHGLEAFVSRELLKIFGEEKLIATDEVLPGQISADFHFKDKCGTDIFVEVAPQKIGRDVLSRVLNLYSALSNLEPPLKKFKLIVVGSRFDVSAINAIEPAHTVNHNR